MRKITNNHIIFITVFALLLVTIIPLNSLFTSKAAEPDTAFEGKVEEWASVDYNAAKGNPNLQEIKAIADIDNLFIYINEETLSEDFCINIINGDTEYTLDSQGSLTNKSTNSITKLSSLNRDANNFEISIPLYIFEDENPEFNIYVNDVNDRLPDGNKFLTVTTPLKDETPHIVVDGNDKDWEGIKPIGHGEGSLGDLYAIRNNNALYVMTYISDVIDSESSASYTTSLFVSLDNNDNTGFIHSGYSKNNTGDILIQDWYSYGPDRNLEIFYAADPVTLEWNMVKQYVEGYEKVFAPTETEGLYCAEYYIPFSSIKEFTENINDDLYVCIDRNDCQTNEETYERLTPEGFTPARDQENGSFAKVIKYQLISDISVEDSNFDDWNIIKNSARHESNTNLFAVKSDEKLYTMIVSDGDLTIDNKYYIETEDDAFLYDGIENVSYCVEKGRLYKVVDNNCLSEDSISVYQYYDKNYCLMQLYLEDIGNPNQISITSNSNEGQYLLPSVGKMIVDKTVINSKDSSLIYPKQSYELLSNPYKGWVCWGDINEGDVDNILAPHNLVYVDIKWSELEPEKGVYAFDQIENQYQFDKWLNKGCRMVLRFVMDNPGLENGNPDIQRMDIPQWLYDELEEENANGIGAGTFYNGQNILELLGGCGFSPDYESPKLLEYHDLAVKALASRYDDPNITAYVEVGSLGHWAEFHTWPTGTGDFPDPELAQRFMKTYADNFHNVKIGIRKPYELAANNNWGLYNDIFGVTSDGGTPSFLEWAATGNTDMPGSTEEDIEASAMPEWWIYNYSGGEFANGDFRTNALTENVCDVLSQIRDSHTSWLGPCSACDYKAGNPEYEDLEYNISVLMDSMGYKYSIYSVSVDSEITVNESSNIDIVWNNEGVAPVYYDCPVYIVLKDLNNKTVYEELIDTDAREWMSGKTNTSTSFNVPSSINSGTYTLSVKMLCADDSNMPIMLANEGINEDGSVDIAKVIIKNNDYSSYIIGLSLLAAMIILTFVLTKKK